MSTKKKVIITGITGQDGYFLTKLLLKKNYEVYGINRRKTGTLYGNLHSLEPEEFKQINFLYGDIMDMKFIFDSIKQIQPDEIYHLAAQSFVHYSFQNPEITYKTNFLASYYLLEGIKLFSPKTAFFMACTSEIFGNLDYTPLRIPSELRPASPYGISKAACFYLVQMYRESYGLYAVNGVSFNHESEMRGEDFVTRKVTIFVAQYEATKKGILELGNLYSKRDWGHSEDFVRGFHDSLQQPKARDYIFATGKSYSVKDFLNVAFKEIGVSIVWEGKGVNEVGIDKATNQVMIKVSPKFLRENDIDMLQGDASDTKKALKWDFKIDFPELVKRMVDNDRKLLRARQAKL